MKTIKLTICAIVVLFAASCSAKIINTVTVEGGKVQGLLTENPEVMLFKGIPYAAPPVGDLRWALPQPVIPWEGVKVCDTWGSPSIQTGRAPGSFYYIEFQPEPLPPTSEDCLYLNVWAPADAVGHPEKKLPVAVWFHGGGNGNGYGYDVAFDGEAYAMRDVILITINYRLGTLGFYNNPELAKENPHGENGNQGIYDQIASVKWAFNNIAQFGGDPNNITIFGQSAGAMDVRTIVASPIAKDYVAKAIIQSGGGLRATKNPAPRPAPAQRPATANLKPGQERGEAPAPSRYGAAPNPALEGLSLAELRKLPVDQLNGIRRGSGNDGYLTVESFDDACYNNRILDIPYMLGANGDDMASLAQGCDRFGEVRDSLSTKPAYIYFFDRKLPGDDAGSFHSAELWYTFNTLGRSWRPMTQHDFDLSEKMVDCWTNFMKYGNPNGDGVDGEWKPCTKANPYVQQFK